MSISPKDQVTIDNYSFFFILLKMANSANIGYVYKINDFY